MTLIEWGTKNHDDNKQVQTEIYFKNFNENVDRNINLQENSFARKFTTNLKVDLRITDKRINT